jgi:hypothetical protein
MNVTDSETIHLEKMQKQLNMLIYKGNISIFHFSKISTFFINQSIMSTTNRGSLKTRPSLLKSFKNHTPCNPEKGPNHTLCLKKPYTLETVFPERHLHNKDLNKVIRSTKESVSRSFSPSFQYSKKDEEGEKIHLELRWPIVQAESLFFVHSQK